MIRPLSCFLIAAFAAISSHAEPREAPAAKVETPTPDSAERRDMTRVQILLDRANFRPGKIDGLGGEFTQKAADRYYVAYSLPYTERLDTTKIPEPYISYTITEDDLKWIGPTASNPPEQEKLKRMPYADAWEVLAEMFHTDIDFVKELNPGITDDKLVAGTVVRVPDVTPFRMVDVVAMEKKRNEDAKARKAASAVAKAAAEANPQAAAQPAPTPEPPPYHLVLLRDQRIVEVYDASNKLIACFPCTPGSSSIPVPAGTWKVTSNILMPYFRYDKSVLKSGVPSDEAYNIPPGPNNYVGIVWMGINRRSVGMHGTNNPDQIGRNQSSGCIRLANWDAILLSQLAVKGTPLEVK